MYTSLKDAGEPLQIREFDTIPGALKALTPIAELDIEDVQRKLELGQAYTTELSPEMADEVMKYER